MTTTHISPRNGTAELEVFQIDPNARYTVDATARLAGVPRRSLLLYCRAGLVRPVWLGPYGVMTFDERTIQTVRRIEHMRATHLHGLDVALIKTIFELLDEVEELRAEVRFLRQR